MLSFWEWNCVLWLFWIPSNSTFEDMSSCVNLMNIKSTFIIKFYTSLYVLRFLLYYMWIYIINSWSLELQFVTVPTILEHLINLSNPVNLRVNKRDLVTYFLQVIGHASEFVDCLSSRSFVGTVVLGYCSINFLSQFDRYATEATRKTPVAVIPRNGAKMSLFLKHKFSINFRELIRA